MPITKGKGKKDGLQQYRVRVNYTDANGKYRQVERTAYGLSEARKLEASMQAQYTSGAPHSGGMTVSELYEEYMQAKKHEVRASTFANSEKFLRLYVIPIVGCARINKLTNLVLQDWKNQLNSSHLSTTSKKHVYAEFRALLNYAIKMTYLEKNPLLSVGNFKDPYFRKPQDRLHFYTPEQFVRYIHEARKVAEQSNSLTDWGYFVFFMIAYYTGMRKGEINALTWNDIEGDIIHIRHSVTQKLKGDDVITPPKNKSSYRDLQIPLPLLDALHEHKARQEQIPGFSDNLYVCGGIRCLRDTSIDKRNRSFANSAGLPRITIHDFRHSHASLLANSGINIQEVARRLGHSNVEMTWNTYSHLYPKEEERALSILNKIKI